MNWFRRKPCRYVKPSNPEWTPETGELIEAAYETEIDTWEVATSRYRSDYSYEQWGRYLVWAYGLSPERLIFVRGLVAAGTVSDG